MWYCFSRGTDIHRRRRKRRKRKARDRRRGRRRRKRRENETIKEEKKEKVDRLVWNRASTSTTRFEVLCNSICLVMRDRTTRLRRPREAAAAAAAATALDGPMSELTRRRSSVDLDGGMMNVKPKLFGLP